jgi:uncharacterized protein YndB with AHSA1/START domain
MTDVTPTNPNVATVERFIPAPADAIFELLANPARHRDIDGSGTVRDADATSTRLSLGDTFGMSMKAGLGYRMENEVVEFEEGRRIAWQPRPAIRFMRRFAGGRIWRYELTPADGGTTVRESWDISQEVHARMVRPLRAATVKSMAATLERIEQVVSR